MFVLQLLLIFTVYDEEMPWRYVLDRGVPTLERFILDKVSHEVSPMYLYPGLDRIQAMYIQKQPPQVHTEN